MTDPDSFPFSFNQAACQACGGKCCRVGGYVWITESELISLAKALGLELEAFADEYVRAAYGRLSLQERLWDGEYLCCLLDPATGSCLAYAARPEQCRTFPFWEKYRDRPVKLLEQCPGVILKEGQGTNGGELE